MSHFTDAIVVSHITPEGQLVVGRNLAGHRESRYYLSQHASGDSVRLTFKGEIFMRFFKFGLFLTLLAAICLPASAQTALRFNVPFNFVAGGKIMPAGQYKVKPVFQDNHITWSIAGNGNSIFLMTNSLQSEQTGHEASLVFLRSGGQLSLTEIWSSEHTGRQVMRTNVKTTLLAQGAKYVEISAE